MDDWKPDLQKALNAHDARQAQTTACQQEMIEYLTSHIPPAAEKIASELEKYGRMLRTRSTEAILKDDSYPLEHFPELIKRGLYPFMCLEVVHDNDIEYAFLVLTTAVGHVGFFSDYGLPHLRPFNHHFVDTPLPFGKDHPKGRGTVKEIADVFIKEYTWAMHWPNKNPVSRILRDPAPRIGFVVEAKDEDKKP